MKHLPIYALLIAVIMLSCNKQHCDNVRNEYESARQRHDEKRKKADDLYMQLEAIPQDSISDRLLMEDELSMALIDIAILEIDMEAYKKQNFDCLHNY